MRIASLCIFLVFIVSCSSSDSGNSAVESKPAGALTVFEKADTAHYVLWDTVKAVVADTKEVAEDAVYSAYADYYVVIADTGLNFDLLNAKMKLLSKKVTVPIDWMGRSYNRKKNLIALPENDADEMYAGEYFPRRYADATYDKKSFFSLEYFSYYANKQVNEKLIALVRGIYATEQEATEVLKALTAHEPNAFMLKAHIYVGCMH